MNKYRVEEKIVTGKRGKEMDVTTYIGNNEIISADHKYYTPYNFNAERYARSVYNKTLRKKRKKLHYEKH